MNNKPHSREKDVSSGSVSANTGHSVNAGGPVGGGARPSKNPGSGAGRRGPVRNGGNPGGPVGGGQYPPPKRSGGLDLKKILIIAVLVVVAYFILKSCMGGGSGIGSLLSGGDGWDDAYNSGYDYTTMYNSSSNADFYGEGAASATSTPTVSTTVSSAARAKYVTPVGNGEDVVTVMVYMCGTDLESKYKMATADLSEMMKATLSEKVNLLVCTGGCKKWNNNVVSSTYNQIHQISGSGIATLESKFAQASMTDSDTLTSFIRYCASNFPASRNILILWDHGGGSVTGYGYDEKYVKNGSMSLAGLNTALSNAGVTFDWIGFDACLMATLETALVTNSYADYLIASEETEPGTGWYYTNWLTELSKNTSADTVAIAQKLIDDYYASNRSSGAQVTLSLIDLAELSGTVPESFNSFATSTTEMIKGDDYKTVASARANCRQFSKANKLNQIDLADFCTRLGTAEAKKLASALKNCVKYNRTNIAGANGISIYFPYESTKSMNSAVSIYDKLGLDDDYTDCIKSFASLETAGQVTAISSMPTSSSFSSSSSYASSYSSSSDLLSSLLSSYAGSSATSTGSSSQSALSSLLGGYTSAGGASAGSSIDASSVLSLLSAFSGRSMPEGMEWVDTGLIAEKSAAISRNYIDPARIALTAKNGGYVLSLTDAEWALIDTIELNVYVDDGDGFIDLGLDNTFDFDGNDLLLGWDGTWCTVNGNLVAYYLVSDTQNDDGTWTTVGRIPALLNGEAVNLTVVFANNSGTGVITGATPIYQDGETDACAKGTIAVESGDRIQPICDRYAENGGYDASYTLGGSFTVGSDGLKLTNMELDDEVSVCYRLTDIYGNHYWTPALVY